MLKKFTGLALIGGVLLTGNLASAVEQGSFEEKASGYSWECVPQKGLPNVLLIGDSISIGYSLQVRQYLKGKANVYRPMDQKKKGNPKNCGDAACGTREIPQWLGKTKWDVIHFNFGLHDLKRIGRDANNNRITNLSVNPIASIPNYKQRLQKCIDLLKPSNAKLIFGTSTPYPAGVSPARLPEDAVTYNNAAKEVMSKNGVVINDLYALTVDRLAELQQPKNVHFKEIGSAVLGKQVATAISKQLGIQINLPKYNTATEAYEQAEALVKSKKNREALEAYKFSASLAFAGAKIRCLEKAAALCEKEKLWEEGSELFTVLLNIPGLKDFSKFNALVGLAKAELEQGNKAESKAHIDTAEKLGSIPTRFKSRYQAVKSAL